MITPKSQVPTAGSFPASLISGQTKTTYIPEKPELEKIMNQKQLQAPIPNPITKNA
jgi:hypothetical protein